MGLLSVAHARLAQLHAKGDREVGGIVGREGLRKEIKLGVQEASRERGGAKSLENSYPLR